MSRKRLLAAASLLALGAAGPVPIAAKPAATKGVANAALAAAGRDASLKDIDYGEKHCDGATTVAAWLKALASHDARAIKWTGGPCRLTNTLNPLDSGSDWCAQATVSLARPKGRDDRPTIEIYFEKPADARPGRAYAFRGMLVTRDGDPDYLRSRKDFEAEWRERFPAANQAASCRDPDR